jgi:hypothetical protein
MPGLKPGVANGKKLTSREMSSMNGANPSVNSALATFSASALRFF